MNPDLDALATRFYVTIDDLLIEHPEWAPERPEVRLAPQLSDAELVTLAIIQALLGFTSEARFIRHAHAHLRPWFPLPPEPVGLQQTPPQRRSPSYQMTAKPTSPEKALSRVTSTTPSSMA
jgi:hypothetical protein